MNLLPPQRRSPRSWPQRLMAGWIQRHGPLTDSLSLTTNPLLPTALPIAQHPDTVTTSVCGFCSTGCGLSIHLRDGQAIGLTPDSSYPVNQGMACPKGWEALSVLDSADRAIRPLRRSQAGHMEPVDWGTALDAFCSNFKRLQKTYGPQSVAFLSTGQIPSEEMFFLGCLAKFGMQLVHGDGNTRQCMATSVAAYKQSFGFDAPPFSYSDLQQSDVLVFVGANPCVAHPILWQRVLNNPHRPSIIVIDPRRTETAMAAVEHVALRPKSDLTLLYGLAQRLVECGQLDRAFIDNHTDGFQEFALHIKQFSPARVEAETGINIAQLERVTSIIAQGKRVSFWWTMGVNQSHQGVATAQAIINLALMTGNIGRPGTGPNSITGQCNAMGSRLFSNTTSLVGHHDFQSSADREKIARLLKMPLDRIPEENCWAYDQILAGIESGLIRGLWIVATNTAHSWINSQRAQRLLDQLDYLVVQDMYSTTETTARADLLLPAAGWGEKDGTFINSERRIGRVKRVRKAPGQALADFSIFRLVADAWGCGSLFRDWTSPAAVFEVMKRVTEGQPCDITGIEDYDMLDRCGGVQWPWPKQPDSDSLPARDRRLFCDGRFYHADGRARFVFADSIPTDEMPDADYPYWLLTGRGSVCQWHTQTRTSKSSVLRQLSPARLYVDINPADAAELRIGDGQGVCISSRRGSIEAAARVTSTVAPGQLYLPMHSPLTNQLTLESIDPVSRQPAYKSSAVRILPLATHPRKVSP